MAKKKKQSIPMTASERIEEKFGGKWERAGKSILNIQPAVPTGSLLLDEAIGECKGWPEGSTIEAYGPQHSGKTLMGYLAIAASQRKHPEREHLIIDAENQFKFQARWARDLGVDVERLFVKPVSSAEEAFDIMEMAILGDVDLDENGYVKKINKPGNFGVIMIDSVTQLVPLEMVHKKMDQSLRMASLASAMSQGLKKTTSAMVTAQSPTIMFFINQIRADPNKMFGSPETRTGGNALPFYATIVLRVAKVWESEERDDRGKIVSHRTRLKFEKNKAGSLPADAIEFKINYDGSGIDNDDEMFGVGELNGIIDNVKRGYYNVVKPGTRELVDENIKNFRKKEFPEVIAQHPHIKDMIQKYIDEGEIYIEDDGMMDSEKEKIAKAKERKEKEEKEEKQQ